MGIISRGDGSIRPWNDRNAQILGCLLCLDLVTHDADVFRSRADKLDAMRFQDFSKTSVSTGIRSLGEPHRRL